jgi:hypothetical protein
VEATSNGLNKPDSLKRRMVRRYRTQEVAGSSPASSIKILLGLFQYSSRSALGRSVFNVSGKASR